MSGPRLVKVKGMHELGVVFSIIKTVEEVAAENDVKEVASVKLHLGEVSTVIPEYLTDCWNWAVKKTEVLKEAKLDIEIIPAVTYCEDCGAAYETVKYGKKQVLLNLAVLLALVLLLCFIWSAFLT